MTRPYGWKLFLWRDEDAGPQSKHGDVRGRRRDRQLLHKRGRRQGKAEIKRQLSQGRQ